MNSMEASVTSTAVRFISRIKVRNAREYFVVVNVEEQDTLNALKAVG
jgi:hypothetical protein